MEPQRAQDPAPGDVAAAVRALVAAHAPRALCPDGVPDDLPLGAEGAGLDSIAVVELLLVCEERFGVPAASLLSATGPLAVGHLIAHARHAQARAPR